jgi:hypothetical protein
MADNEALEWAARPLQSIHVMSSGLRMPFAPEPQNVRIDHRRRNRDAP